jgi:hypothetical protein
MAKGITKGEAAKCANPQPGNVQFTYAQLEYIWQTAGGSAPAAPIAAAVAMAESGGNSGATDCDSNGTIDRGLWQINSVHGSMSTYDVMGNARAAVSISNNGSNWSAWSTYNNGAYRQYVQTNVNPQPTPINATNAQANLTGAYGIPGLPSQLDPSWWTQQAGNAVYGIIKAVLNPLIQVVAGVLGVTAGGVLVLVGIFVLVRQSQAGRDITNLGLAAIPGGAEEEAAAKAAAPKTTVRRTYTQSGQTSPLGEPLRTMRVTSRTDGTTHTRSVQEVLRGESWEYYTPPTEGPKTESGRPGWFIR